jgi:hypothetical protein
MTNYNQQKKLWETRKDITLLCMYLNSQEEESTKEPGKKIRKVSLNYDGDIITSLDYESMVEPCPGSINLTADGIARAEELMEKYLTEEKIS